MQTHIGCIFFTFLHFACMRRHNHIGCTCLTSYQFSSLSQELRYCHSFPDFSPSLPRRKWGEGCVTSALPMHCIVMSRGHWFSRSLFHWNKKSKSEIQCSHSSLTSLHYGEVVMENGNWFTRSFWAKVSLSLSKSLSFALISLVKIEKIGRKKQFFRLWTHFFPIWGCCHKKCSSQGVLFYQGTLGNLVLTVLTHVRLQTSCLNKVPCETMVPCYG